MSHDSTAVSEKQVLSTAPGADGDHVTFCRLCEAQCGLIARVRNGRIVHVGPDRRHPVSAGHLCVKGPGMLEVMYDEDRVLTPLRRRADAGDFEPVSWDQALDDIATRLRTIVDTHNGSTVGLYVGNPAAFATLHYAYAFSFLRLVGGSKLFGPLHVDTGAKRVACQFVYGSGMRYSFPDLERADFLLMLGANPMMSHMSLISEPRALQRLDAIARRGGVVVVDPRRTETAKRFEHVAVIPDSDAWLLAGILRTIFDENLIDVARLDEKVEGWRSLRAALLSLPVETAAARCGVSAEVIRALARRLSTARAGACYGRVGTNRGRFSTLTNVFIEALNILTGKFGEPGGWVMGESPFGEGTGEEQYARKRSRIGNVPIVGGAVPGSTLADEILMTGEGQVRALFLDSGNPVMAYPRGDRLAEALEELDLFVSLDLYVNESNRHADYILPVTTFLERADMNELWCANAPRPWLHAVDAVVPPVGDSRHEFMIYDTLLQRLGLPSPLSGIRGTTSERPGYMEAADAMLRAGPLGDHYGERSEGLTLEKLRDEYPNGLRYKESVDAAASWSRVRFADRKVRVWNPVISEEFARLLASPSSAPEELKLFGRRKLRSLNSWMHNSPKLVRSDSPTLLMHPDDAHERNITDGQTVTIRSRTNSLSVTVEITDEVVRGSVNYPHGWGHAGGWHHANAMPGVNINLLASDDPNDLEQVSGMVLLDGIPVSVVAS